MSEVNANRLVALFQNLVSIDSESFHERRMNDYLQKIWRKLGIVLREDDAAAKIGGSAGNLYGMWRSEPASEKPAEEAADEQDSWSPIKTPCPASEKPAEEAADEHRENSPETAEDNTIIFCAHQDTVRPGMGKRAVIREDGRITSDGRTVLGADDAAALATIYEAVCEIQEEQIPHKNIELFFPVAEEAYTQGSSAFDFSQVHAKIGYCLDCSDRFGSYSPQEPTLISFCFHVHGRAAHAGFNPEAGINALSAAARAVARIPQGRLNDHSTFNFGMIHGGTNTNVVPEDVVVEGELRSTVHEDALNLYENAAGIFREEAEIIGAAFEEDMQIRLHAYRISEDDPAFVRYAEALKKFGAEPYPNPNFGGSDCNVMIRNGIHALCVFNSMHNLHTTQEYAIVDEMVRMTGVVKELMRL